MADEQKLSGIPEAPKPRLELPVRDGLRGTEYLVGIVDESRGLGFTVFRFRAPKVEGDPPPEFVTQVNTFAFAVTSASVAGLSAQTGPMGGVVRNEPELWLPSSGTPKVLGVVRRRLLAEES